MLKTKYIDLQSLMAKYKFVESRNGRLLLFEEDYGMTFDSETVKSETILHQRRERLDAEYPVTHCYGYRKF